MRKNRSLKKVVESAGLIRAPAMARIYRHFWWEVQLRQVLNTADWHPLRCETLSSNSSLLSLQVGQPGPVPVASRLSKSLSRRKHTNSSLHALAGAVLSTISQTTAGHIRSTPPLLLRAHWQRPLQLGAAPARAQKPLRKHPSRRRPVPWDWAPLQQGLRGPTGAPWPAPAPLQPRAA